MSNRFQVIIVGSGPAGIAAADLLSRYGLTILVLDENRHMGGQLIRKPPGTYPGIRPFEPDGFKRQGKRLAGQLGNRNIHLIHQAQVLGIYPGPTLLVAHPDGQIKDYRADSLILATGARERHLPFKGWTLPGVMTTGAAQILMKSSGILPGRETLIAGTSPLMFVLASELCASHAKVRAVLDQSRATEKFKAVFAGRAALPKLVEGAHHAARMALSHIPLKQGVRIVEAEGNPYLESVVWARVTSQGKIIPGTETRSSIETLAVGYGFSPNIELPIQAGCQVSHAIDRGGWYVTTGPFMETSVHGIYAVGETTGIGGGGKSFIEGKIAAWDILLRHGLVAQEIRETRIKPLIRQQRRQIRYGRILNRVCRPAPLCYRDIPDETLICRCEEITMGDIRRQVANGFETLAGMKKATRCGMGNCQGRTCGPVLADIISALTGKPAAAIGCPAPRAPIKPVALGSLAAMTVSGNTPI